MNNACVTCKIEERIARVTLNRPENGNAIDQRMASALLETALTCASDEAIRCVLLSANGKMFCVGGDVSAFSQNEANISGFLSELAGVLHLAMAQFAAMRKPLVTLVNGPAAGAGMSLAISGDIVLAARSSHFTTAYGAIGLTPDGGMTWTLPRLVGMRRAQELILTNRRVSAEEAAGMGLVTKVVGDDQLLAEGEEIARKLAGGAIQAMGAARMLLHESATTGFVGQMDREARSIAAAGRGEEGREGVTAFLERRKPNFAS